MILETDRLLLKSSHCDFAKALCEYYNRNKGFLEPFEPKREASFYTVDSQKSILQSEVEQEDRKTSYRFYIFLKDKPDLLIGSIALNNIVWGGFRSCFMGCKLSENYVNYGYMTEATKRVVQYAFEEIKLHRIEGNVMPRNKASLALLNKCKFIEEGYSPKYLQINGVWEDHIHMVILNENL